MKLRTIAAVKKNNTIYFSPMYLNGVFSLDLDNDNEVRCINIFKEEKNWIFYIEEYMYIKTMYGLYLNKLNMLQNLILQQMRYKYINLDITNNLSMECFSILIVLYLMINIYVWFQEIQMLWLLLIWKREKKK